MSKFYCKCGFIAKEGEYKEELDGIHFSIPSFYNFSDSVAKNIESFVKAQANGESSDWLKSFFGDGYPLDDNLLSVIEDIIAAESNDSKFKSTFKCPNCGSFAMGDEEGWVFYNP